MIGLKDKSNFLELYLYPAIRLDLVEPIYPGKAETPATEIPSYGERSGFN